MKIKLIQPPIWIPTQPYLSVPSLVSYLKKNKINVEQLDMNLITFDYLFSKEFMINCFLKLRSFELDIEKQENYDEVIKYIQIENFIIQNLDKYREGFKTEKCTNYYEYVSHRYFLETCIKIINASYINEILKFDDYSINYNIFNSQDLKKLFVDYDNGLLDDYIINKIIKNGIRSFSIEDNALIGISITGTSQIVASLLLAKAIKKVNNNVKIVIGGNVPSRWIDSFDKIKYIFDFIDYIILNEGEEPLLQLIDYLNGEKSIDEVNSLVYLNEESEIIINKKAKKLSIDHLETPVFDQKTIDNYYSPINILPLLSSRGCYWGKCSFCDHSYVYQKNYTIRSIKELIKDINEYYNKYGVKHVNFHDEAISPKRIEDLSNELLDNNIKINWTCDAKIEKSFDLNKLRKAKRAGLKVLFFGFESANQRVLDSMNKGIKIKHLKKILEHSTDIGIWNHLFYFKGFPGETDDEFRDTINFLKDNNSIIQSTGGGNFSLNRFSGVALNPDKFNVIIEPNNNDIDFSFDFKVDNKKKIKYFSNKELTNTKVMGSFFILSNNIFRDHWVLFADTISEYVKEGYEYEDRYFYPWVYTNKGSLIINLNQGLVLKVEAFVINIFNMLNNNSKSLEIINNIAEHLNVSYDDSEEIFHGLLNVFYDNRLMAKSKLNIR